jgi:DNA-directed RNA polymerase subunit RPC12/RpoP
MNLKCEKCGKESSSLDETSVLLGDYFCEECRSD